VSLLQKCPVTSSQRLSHLPYNFGAYCCIVIKIPFNISTAPGVPKLRFKDHVCRVLNKCKISLSDLEAT